MVHDSWRITQNTTISNIKNPIFNKKNSKKESHETKVQSKSIPQIRINTSPNQIKFFMNFFRVSLKFMILFLLFISV